MQNVMNDFVDPINPLGHIVYKPGVHVVHWVENPLTIVPEVLSSNPSMDYELPYARCIETNIYLGTICPLMYNYIVYWKYLKVVTVR